MPAEHPAAKPRCTVCGGEGNHYFADHEPVYADSAAQTPEWDVETVVWLLQEARACVSELAAEVSEHFIIDKDEPPQLRKAREVIEEIDDYLGDGVIVGGD